MAGNNTLNCLVPGVIGYSANCVNLIDPTNLVAGIEGGMATIAAGRVWYSNPIPVAWLFNAITTNGVCSGSACDSTAGCATSGATVYIYFWAQTTSNSTPDMQDSLFPVSLVGQSAFVPSDISVVGGNEAVTVNWNWPNGLSPSGNQAFLGVQLFCVRGPDLQVFQNGAYGRSFMTASTLCKDIVPPTPGIAALDPDFLCSGLLPSTSTSYRIKGLQNGIYYGVGVAAIDKYQNASPITTLYYAQAIPTVDFYTEYKDLGGKAQGGYCAVAKGKRASGLLAVAGLVALGLVGWRRRRRRKPGAGPLAVILVTSSLWAGPARAQAVYHEDGVLEDRAREVWKGSPRNFAVEARFALYTPAIDSEFSGPGIKPQSFVFGNRRRPMWQLEFDWEVLQIFGTLSIGGVIGYYKENANACEGAALDNTKGTCSKFSADNTSLTLIPFAALAVYRFDVLAEHWKIPLVPYGKVGLNYTLWSVADGNGDTPSDRGGHGAGGTMGWQAAVGLSLQLDWIDPGAARVFDAESGVNHTYAFFELATIQSSGLGSGNALHVGDNTWFAGLMFEF